MTRSTPGRAMRRARRTDGRRNDQTQLRGADGSARCASACLGFGGPAGQIALMHRVFVEEKRWIDEPRYLHALNFCMLLPGPRGAAAGDLCRLAAARRSAAVWSPERCSSCRARSSCSASAGSTRPTGETRRWLAAAFVGVKAAVVALVAEAMWKIGKRALKGRGDLAIAVVAFAALALFGLPFPLVVLAAAAWGALRRAPADAGGHETTPHVQPRRLAARCSRRWSGAWCGWRRWRRRSSSSGPDHLLTEVGETFSTLAVVTFGGAYAVLAYLQQTAVETHGWLTAADDRRPRPRRDHAGAADPGQPVRGLHGGLEPERPWSGRSPPRRWPPGATFAPVVDVHLRRRPVRRSVAAQPPGVGRAGTPSPPRCSA